MELAVTWTTIRYGTRRLGQRGLLIVRWQDLFNPPSDHLLNAWLSTGVLLLGCPVVFSIGLYLAKANAGTPSHSGEGIAYFLFMPLFGLIVACVSLVCLTARTFGIVILNL